MSDLKFSILIPTYNGAGVITETLKSILSQSFTNYEIIIQDDASKDNTEKAIKKINDSRIKFYKNRKNLSYAVNLEQGRKNCTGEIIYLMGQDDILAKDALLNTYNAFKMSDKIGAVTRPYFWFFNDIQEPVRAKKQLYPDQNKDEIVKITDDFKRVLAVFRTLDQLSGLAYRVKYMDKGFHSDCFPCHIYPFASIFKKHPIVFLKDYNIAVRILSSQTRYISSIYEKSPMLSWVQMFDNVFHEPQFKKFKKKMIKNFVATNYVGLVQLKNYARYQVLLREIFYLLKYRRQNIFSPQFYFFSLGCALTPASILIPLVDLYKNKINTKLISNINFDYSYE